MYHADPVRAFAGLTSIDEVLGRFLNRRLLSIPLRSFILFLKQNPPPPRQLHPLKPPVPPRELQWCENGVVPKIDDASCKSRTASSRGGTVKVFFLVKSKRHRRRVNGNHFRHTRRANLAVFVPANREPRRQLLVRSHHVFPPNNRRPLFYRFLPQ